MWEIISAALLLLSLYAPNAYDIVSQYEIRTTELPYNGTALCEEGIIVVSITVNRTAEEMAGTLAHEAKHLDADCPMYDNLAFGKRLYREAYAYRYQIQTLRLIPNTGALQERATKWYWDMWWREHGAVRSLGILP